MPSAQPGACRNRRIQLLSPECSRRPSWRRRKSHRLLSLGSVAKVEDARHCAVTKQPSWALPVYASKIATAMRSPISGHLSLCSLSPLACDPYLHSCPRYGTMVYLQSHLQQADVCLDPDTLIGRWDLLVPAQTLRTKLVLVPLRAVFSPLDLGRRFAHQRIARATFCRAGCPVF